MVRARSEGGATASGQAGGAWTSWQRRVAPLVVLMVGLVGTLALAEIARTKPGVYWSRTQVQFFEPRTFNPDGLAVDNGFGVIAIASVVAEDVTDKDGPRLTSPDSTLAAAGVRHGVSVMLPNYGGQWANVFTDPWLDVQAVGTSTDEVRAAMARVLAQVQQALTRLQADAHVSRENLITTQLSPPGDPPLFYLAGSPKRAAAVSLLLGLGLTALAWNVTRTVLRPSARWVSPMNGRRAADPVSRVAT